MKTHAIRLVDWYMKFNATFNNISVISLTVSFIGGGNRSTGRKLQYRPIASH